MGLKFRQNRLWNDGISRSGALRFGQIWAGKLRESPLPPSFHNPLTNLDKLTNLLISFVFPLLTCSVFSKTYGRSFSLRAVWHNSGSINKQSRNNARSMKSLNTSRRSSRMSSHVTCWLKINKSGINWLNLVFLKVHSQKPASCSKSPAGLWPCSHQADIRMRSHRLLRLDDNKSSASCQQACCKLIFRTFYPQASRKMF